MPRAEHRRPQKDDQVDQHRGKTVTIDIGGGAESCQLDGDVVGEAAHLVARVKPAALTICVPQPNSDADQSLR